VGIRGRSEFDQKKEKFNRRYRKSRLRRADATAGSCQRYLLAML
jgi:hypothetical protein